MVLKARLRDAEKAKRKIIGEGILSEEYAVGKDGKYIYFPLKGRPGFRGKEFGIINRKMKKKKTPPSKDLRTLLKGKLSRKEFERLKTSFDTIGAIAVLEIDRELRRKEKTIAEALLESNKSIKTVLRKDERHEGEFRTQRMKWLAGKKTKETIHRENGVALRLDVEKVYFSPRLSTDRKRIMQQVKPGEEILVMFSGCAPYPCVLSKNTKAKSIVGIEINPEGHRYGLGNLELNRLRNVALICGDVKKEVPRINRHIIGLKSAIDGKELKSRLAENPLIMELHLFKKDLFGNKPALEKTILRLKKKKIQIILHMPFPEKEDCWLGGKKPENALKTLKVLGELCKKHGAAAVVHVTWGIPEIGEEEIANNVRKLREYYDYFYFENGIKGFGKTEQVLRIGGQAGIKNVCIDTAHLYIIYRDSEKIIDHIERMQQDFGTYFHLSDSDGTTEGGLFDSGFIDLKRIIPYVQKGIAEVRSRDEKNPLEMTGSFREVTSEQRKFDRILMPLPKSAGDFIGTALLAARKGTIIHFYSFLREDDFAGAERIVGAACRKAGRKWRKLALVKCGQHAPRTFRVCLDFEVLD